jgi:Tol biopolymer transport system component
MNFLFSQLCEARVKVHFYIVGFVLRFVVLVMLLLGVGIVASRLIGERQHLPMLQFANQPSIRSPMTRYAADISTGIIVKVSPGEWPETIPTKFSPDGQWKVYSSDEEGRAGLYLGRSDGGSGRYITASIGSHWYNAWSADSQYFIYSHYFSTVGQIIHAQLILISADGRLMKELQRDIAPNFFISPNREWLIFYRRVEDNFHFYLMPLHLEGNAQSLPLPFIYFNPFVWSPDSRHVIASRYGTSTSEDSEPSDPYLVTLDTEVTSMRLTNIHDGNFKWSPNSRYVAVLTNYPNPASSLSIFELETKRVVNLRLKNSLDSSFLEFEDAFEWSPDSQWLVFRRLTADGQLKMQLYNIWTERTLAVDIASQGHTYYSWTPDSEWVAFTAQAEINDEPLQTYAFHLPSQQIYPITKTYLQFLDWYTDAQDVLELRRVCGQACSKN